jgi:hypothetical protein
VCQFNHEQLIHRYREQAHSYRGFAVYQGMRMTLSPLP